MSEPVTGPALAPEVRPGEADLAAALHRAAEHHFDYCDHGRYVGGPKNGQPYAACELLAAAAYGPIAEAVREQIAQAIEAMEITTFVGNWDYAPNIRVAAAHLARRTP